MENKVLICEDSIEGILTGIYEAYARHFAPKCTFIQIGEQEEIQLFSEYYNIETKQEKADKVAGTLRRILGERGLGQLYLALASEDLLKGQAVYQVVVQVLYNKNNPDKVLDNLADSHVRKVFELARNVNNEILHLHGFLRFAELEQGILYAMIGPKNNIVPLLMPHFADRFPLENFMIYDEKRELFGVHPKGGEWYIIRDVKEDSFELKYSQSEENYQELFRYFCHKIAIEARTNPKLQQNMLPLRFRDYMVEFEGRK